MYEAIALRPLAQWLLYMEIICKVIFEETRQQNCNKYEEKIKKVY